MLEKTDMSFSQQLKLVLYLSIPAVMAQITSIIMQYIHAFMVGRLGAAKSGVDWPGIQQHMAVWGPLYRGGGRIRCPGGSVNRDRENLFP